MSATIAIRLKPARAFGDGLEHRHALGAQGQAVGCVLDVASGVNAAGAVFQCGADAEPGEGRVSMFTRGQCGVAKEVETSSDTSPSDI